MIRGLEAVLLSTENAKRLAEFYKEKVGLKIGEPLEVGDNGEEAYEVELKGTNLYIMDHSEIKGKNRDSSRVMFNLEVDDIEKDFEKLKKEGVKVVTEPYHVEGYGLIATFEDIDGNYFQFVQIKPTES